MAAQVAHSSRGWAAPEWLDAGPSLLSAALTLPFLSTSPLWADEVDTASAAGRPLGALLLLLRHQDGPLAGYYLLLHGWLQLVGTSAWSLRLPSAVALVAAVAVTTRLGRRVVGPAGGLLAGSLLATNPFVLFFGVDARPYAGAVLAAAASGLILFGAPGVPSRRRRALLGGVVVAGVLAHLFFLLAVAAQLLGLRGSRRPLRPWLLPTGLALLLTSPLLLLSATQTAEVGYLHGPGLLSVPGWFQALAGGKAWLSVPAALVLATALVSRRFPHPQLACWLLLPGPVLLLVSLVHPLYLNRYVVESAPALSLLLAAILVRARARVLAGSLAVALLLASAVTGGVAQAATFRYEDPRAAADLVLDGATPRDGAVFLPDGVRTAVSFYLARLDRGAPTPTDLTASPGHDENAAGNFGGLPTTPRETRRRMLGRQVIWLLSYADPSARAGATAAVVLAELARCYRPDRLHRFGELLVQRQVATGRCATVSR